MYNGEEDVNESLVIHEASGIKCPEEKKIWANSCVVNTNYQLDRI